MRWVWLGLLVLVMAVMPATAQETKLDESKMLIVAYYQAPVSLKGTIDMEKVYKAFDKIEYADPNGKYIDGIIYKDYPKDFFELFTIAIPTNTTTAIDIKPILKIPIK